MRRFSALAVLIALAVALTGCLQEENTYTLNPDGSGKVLHTAVIDPGGFSMGGEEADPEAELRSTLRKELEDCEGIEAWADVTAERKDDKIHFSGTAYFKDFRKVKFHNGGTSMKIFENIEWIPGDEGQMILRLGGESTPEDETKSPAPASDEEVKAQRDQYKQMRPMMVGMVSEMKSTSVYDLPGEIVSSSNMVRRADNSVRLAISGPQLLDTMDKLVADDAYMKRMIGSGRNLKKDGPSVDAKFNETMFGDLGPVEVVFTLGEDQFDYAAEVAAAKENEAAMLQELNLGSMVVSAPAEGEGFTSIRVGGVRMVRESDMESEVRPFNWDKGYSISLIGELPGSVLKVSEGELITATGDDGSDLLPENEWDRRISFPRLSKNKSTVVWEVSVRLPENGVKGFKELGGTLEYFTAGEAKEAQLAFGKLAEGETAQPYNASIKKMGKAEWGDGFQIEIRLELDSAAIESVIFRTASGEDIEANRSMSMGGGGSTTLTYNSDNPFPEDAKVYVKVYGDMKKFTIPFKIENIDLLGNPR